MEKSLYMQQFNVKNRPFSQTKPCTAFRMARDRTFHTSSPEVPARQWAASYHPEHGVQEFRGGFDIPAANRQKCVR